MKWVTIMLHWDEEDFQQQSLFNAMFNAPNSLSYGASQFLWELLSKKNGSRPISYTTSALRLLLKGNGYGTKK